MIAYQLTAARTHVLRSEPDTIVLALEYGEGETLHLTLSRAEFARMAKQMGHDSAMMTGGSDGAVC